MKQKSIIAFDFDGTIADTALLEKRSMIETIRYFGNLEIDENNIETHYGPTEIGIISSLVPSGKREEVCRKFLEIYQKIQPETLPSCVPGMKELLLELSSCRDIHLIEVTGRSKESLALSLAYLDIQDCFEKCYTGSDRGINKHLSLNQACQDYRVDKEEILYIGDTIEDCQTMHGHGYDLISVSYCHDEGYHKELEKLNPGLVAEDVEHLQALLNQLIR